MASARELLGVGLYARSRNDEALEQFQQLAKIRAACLGAEHPLTLQSRCNIGIVLWALGQRNEACQVFDETYRAQEKANTLCHRGTISTMQILAFMYHFSERSFEAQKVQKRVVDALVKFCEPGDGDLLKSTILLSAIYRDMEWWKEAEPICRLVVMAVQQQGIESPATIASTANLIQTIEEQGRLDEAAQLCRDIVERSSMVSGPESPPTLRNKFQLTKILRAKGGHEAALSVLEEIFSTERVLYGDDDEDTINAMRGIITSTKL